MGMGYGANFADTVEEYFVKRMCPKEFQEFEESFDSCKPNSDYDDMDTFAAYVQQNGYDENSDCPVQVAFKKLSEAFKDNTGLELYLMYHSMDDGDRYDDLDGRAWEVANVYQLTPAAARWADEISRKFYVTFG